MRLNTYPVLTLPNEITSEIFLRFLPEYPLCPPLIGSLSPTLLTHICRQWRVIAIANPALWRAISLSFRQPDRNNHEQKIALMTVWLARSGALPLSIRISIQCMHDDCMHSHGCMESLIHHRSRWEYLQVTDVLPHPLPSFAGSAPLLQQLEFSGSSWANTLEDYQVASDVAPLLRTAILGRELVPIITLPWLQLTSLTLLCVYSSECTLILPHTKNLVHCALALWTTSGPQAPVDVQPDLTLPRLESLVMMTWTEDVYPSKHYLDSLILPALRKLVVEDECLGVDPIGSLTSFISRSGCKLQELCITGPMSVPEDLYRKGLPSISNLTFDAAITGWSHYNTSDVLPDPDDVLYYDSEDSDEE
ncbi:hypothetical protein C8R43DRAFT_873594 [Mycena crocata]|nr:hypothetical protein C8R43DRAFT_873594 [Mycena crocata]